MQITIDIPDDLYKHVSESAQRQQLSLSDLTADLIRAGLEVLDQPVVERGVRGMPVVSVDHPVTPEDVRAVEDDW